MKDSDTKVRISTAIPKGMFICTNGTFIVFVGKVGDDLIPDLEFDLLHISEADKVLLDLAKCLTGMAA